MAKRSATGGKVARPGSGRRRWPSFVAEDITPWKVVRGLHEQANPRHRLRVEHDAHTLLVHLSDEDGGGWTTFAVDRATRQWRWPRRPTKPMPPATPYDGLYDR